MPSSAAVSIKLHNNPNFSSNEIIYFSAAEYTEKD